MEADNILQLKHFSDFDELPDLILIEDAETREILYKNRAWMESVPELGKKLPTFDKRFISINSHISTIEGRKVVIEVAKSILPVTTSSYNMDARTIISDIENDMRSELQSAYLYVENGKKTHDILIDSVIYKMMDFYESEYAQLFIFTNNDPYQNGKLYQYRRGDYKNPLPKSIPLNDYWFNSLPNYYERGFSLVCEDMKGFDAFDSVLYQRFIERGINTVIIIPLFMERELCGFFTFSNPKKVDGKLDLFLADYAANSIGALLYRGFLYSKLYFDHITDLPWLNVLYNFYPEYLKEHKDKPIVILDMDFHHFRNINRSYGTVFADEVLRKTAAVLTSRYTHSLLARKNGSDNFVIITTGVAENIALEVSKIREEITSQFQELALHIAVGIYQVKDKSEEFGQCLLKASFAHRYAKEDILIPIRIFDDEMDKVEIKSQFYSSRFHQSIEKEEFLVYIQPKYNLETEAYFGGEALVRWNLNGKLVPPGDFIPLFESNGLCRELDFYVLKQVCKTLRRWLDTEPEKVVPISVNFSRADFGDPTIFEHILFILKEYRIPTDLIEVEITESAYVDFEVQIVAFVKKCSEAGIRVLMDDFGSGESSLNSLRYLNFDILKLDCKFLSHSQNQKKERKVIEAVVALARSIDVPIIVEGVETRMEAEYFRSLGVYYIQGYLFGKPMPMEEFEQILNKKRIHDVSINDDTKLILNDLLDARSNVHFIMEQFANPCGIFRLDDNGMYCQFLNKKGRDSLSYLGALNLFQNSSLIDFVSPSYQQKCLDCLRGARELYQFTEFKEIPFTFGLEVYRIAISSMLVRTGSNCRYYFVIGFPNLKDSTKGNKIEEKELLELFSSPLYGVLLTDKSGIVLTYNKTLKADFADLTEGKSFEEVFGQEFSTTIGRKRVFCKTSNLVFEASCTVTHFQGKECNLFIFSKLGNPNKYIVETTDTGFKFYDRILSTLEKVATYYVEIDLDLDYCTRLQLNSAYENPLVSGNYSQEFYPKLLSLISDNERKKVERFMNIQSLKDRAGSLAPFEMTYKLYGKMEFRRCRIKFYFDRGHHYACYFVEDITESKMSEYDALTNCLNRTTGKNLIDNYLGQHLLDPAALLIMDIDKFKVLNDTYGHPIGDKVLGKIKERFLRLGNRFEFATRMGGDEFCILLKQRGENFDKEAMRKELSDVMKDIGYDVGLDQELHVSCGIALMPENGSCFSALYPIADGDLYDQKRWKKQKEEQGKE